MHSPIPRTTVPPAHPTGVPRVRRFGAILAIGTLPLIAAACAKPADTTVGAGAGSAPSSVADTSGASASPSVPSSSTSEPEGSVPSSQESPVSSPSAPSEPSGSSAVPDSVMGSAWTSTSIEGRPAVEGSPLEISFDASGERAGLNAGCNSMGGAPVFDGDALSVPEIVSTMMACEAGGGAIMKQESWYSRWLTEGVSWSVDGTTLTLEGDGVTVVFERSGDADTAPSSGTADPDSPTSAPGTDGGATTDNDMTTQAEPGPVETPRTPISGATIVPGSGGSAIPIPPTTK